jgi:hypothetical protein
VTIVEKPKQKPTAAADESAPKPAAKEPSKEAKTTKVATEIGLGSDISVTLVQKKKSDGAEETSGTAAAAARTPKISVKKESELLQDPQSAKDVVQVFIF